MSLAGLLTDTVSYKAPTSVNNAGDPTFGALQTLAARVEKAERTYRDEAGIERTGGHLVLSETEIPEDSKVWLPGESTSDEGVAHRIVAAESSSTPDGAITLHETWLTE